jgi:hypothetical protein
MGITDEFLSVQEINSKPNAVLCVHGFQLYTISAAAQKLPINQVKLYVT